METANSPQNNSKVEVEAFTCYFPLTNKIILDKEIKVTELGALKVQGFAKRYPNALGEVVISTEIKRIRFNGLDVAPILTHWKGDTMEDVRAFAEKHVLTVTFAPKPTRENVLNAISDTVYALRGHEPLSLSTPIIIRLSDVDNDLVQVEGLVVTPKGGLIVLDGSGNGHPLETADVNADKMIAGIYKGLEKRFPNQVKAIV